MAAIPQSAHEIVDQIYKGLEKQLQNKPRLTRVGASGIGKECLRAIWYGWRGYTNKQHDGRLLRLFQTGHLQEDRIVSDLKYAGLSVWEIDESTKQQWTYNDPSGHFVVKLDGVVKGVPGSEKTPHVLEIKTHYMKSFEEVQKFGVFRAKPEHYDQMTCGMMFSELDRALYVALCKDNESYYVERVVFDNDRADQLKKKIISVINSTLPPTRISEKDDFLDCRFCDHKEVCKKGVAPERTCRSCEYAEVEAGGAWSCSLMNVVLSADDQLTCVACRGENYSVIKG